MQQPFDNNEATHVHFHRLLTDIELVKQQLKFEKEVREAQAEEYERRLGELNHAHAEAVRVQNTYVAGDVYDRDHRELVGRVDKLDRASLTREMYEINHKELAERVDRLETQHSELRAQYAVAGFLVTIGLVILNIAVGIVLRVIVK